MNSFSALWFVVIIICGGYRKGGGGNGGDDDVQCEVPEDEIRNVSLSLPLSIINLWTQLILRFRK